MAGRIILHVDQAELENQIVHRYQQECGNDTDLDSAVCLSASGFSKFQSKLKKSMQQMLRLLQLNLFEKRDLMAMLRGDPQRDSQINSN